MNHRCRNNRLQRAVGMVLIGGMIVLGSAVIDCPLGVPGPQAL